MRTLSALSFLGLLAFIGFSAVSRGDVYEEPQSPCDQCEVYEDYDETVDPKEIVNNIEVNNYIWIDNRRVENNYYGSSRHGDIHRRRGGHAPEVLPIQPRYPTYPQPFARPICRIGRVGWSHMFDLWVGNRLIQRHQWNVVVNSYWYYVRSGQCVPG